MSPGGMCLSQKFRKKLRFRQPARIMRKPSSASAFSGKDFMSATMRAVVFRGEGKWAVESVAVPRVRADDDVLLKVDRGSICGTDLHILSVPPAHPATPGSILGHEYVATVVE